MLTRDKNCLTRSIVIVETQLNVYAIVISVIIDFVKSLVISCIITDIYWQLLHKITNANPRPDPNPNPYRTLTQTVTLTTHFTQSQTKITVIITHDSDAWHRDEWISCKKVHSVIDCRQMCNVYLQCTIRIAYARKGDFSDDAWKFHAL